MSIHTHTHMCFDWWKMLSFIWREDMGFTSAYVQSSPCHLIVSVCVYAVFELCIFRNIVYLIQKKPHSLAQFPAASLHTWSLSVAYWMNNNSCVLTALNKPVCLITGFYSCKWQLLENTTILITDGVKYSLPSKGGFKENGHVSLQSGESFSLLLLHT